MSVQLLADAARQHVPYISLILFVGLPIFYMVYNAIYNLYFHPLAKYPGPLICRISRLPWDSWQLRGRLQDNVSKIHFKYGDAVRIAPNELSFTSQQAWNDIYSVGKGKEQWPRHPRRVPQGKNAPMSIMNTVPREHARFRRLLNHAFSEKGLQEQAPIMNKYIDLLVKKIGILAEQGKSTDFTSWLHMCTFDIISDLGWNEPFNCVEKETEHSWIKTIVTTAFDTQLKLVLRENGFVWAAPYFIPKRLQQDRLENFKYATARVEDRINSGGVRGDFWDRVMIKSVDGNEAGEGLTKREMVVTAVTLVGTGSETVSTLLTGMVYFLGTNLNILNRLEAEIRDTFTSYDDITLPNLNKLPYLTACLQETMRLYPPVVGLLWRVPPAGGARVMGEYIPEGTSVNMSLPGMFKNPKNFARPTDFVPERWLANAPAEFAHDNKAIFKPFSMGAMNCLGQNLANAESRLIMAKILYKYNMELDAEKTPADWLDQKSWAVFVKKHMHVRFSVAAK